MLTLEKKPQMRKKRTADYTRHSLQSVSQEVLFPLQLWSGFGSVANSHAAFNYRRSQRHHKIVIEPSKLTREANNRAKLIASSIEVFSIPPRLL